jgi:hypothetical protein
MTHGTRSGYAKYGCRCPDCTAAQRARMREYRQRRTAAIPTDAGATNLGTTEIGPSDARTSPGRGDKEYALTQFGQYPLSGGGA